MDVDLGDRSSFDRCARLMVCVQSGDADSYRVLLRSLVPYIRRMVRGHHRDQNSLDDLIQEILISIHRALATYDFRRPFKPWLDAIIRYRVIDSLRTRKLYEKHLGLDDLPDETFIQPEVASSDLHDKLMSAILTLPEKQKLVVEHLKLEGMSVKETALKTRMSEAAVRVTAHRAYLALKKRLAEVTAYDE